MHHKGSGITLGWGDLSNTAGKASIAGFEEVTEMVYRWLWLKITRRCC
jgi:hypothetical protein